MSDNPYAATTSAEVVRPEASSEAELIRKRFLNHEASVQSIGSLYVLGVSSAYWGRQLFYMADYPPASSQTTLTFRRALKRWAL